MVENIFPADFAKLIKYYIDEDNLYEIRIRRNKAFVFNIANQIFFLSNSGLTKNIKDGIIATKETIEKILYIVSGGSIYAVNNEIKNGFITIKNGVRIGLSGEVVYNNDNIVTLKNIDYLNIRLPHKIDNCSERIFSYLIGKPFKNTLIISPPGRGKTTMLRDIIYQIGKSNYVLNCLVVDERFEIVGCTDNGVGFDLGNMVDVISGSEKSFGFEIGIRTMNPDIIFTDEIYKDSDIKSLEYAISCGVSIVATIHSSSIEDLLKKKILSNIIEKGFFERYLVLSKSKGVGTIDGLYDENLQLLYRD